MRLTAMSAATLLTLVSAAGVRAQDGAAAYPLKPIRMIVPQAAGGPSDTIARIIAHKLAEVIGQTVVVDNRAGASGIIGIEIGARSPPDGYTVVIVSNIISINPAIHRKVSYNFDRDLAAVSLLTISPYLLTVHPSLPVKSVKELIALAKARPGELNHASGGIGTGPHLAMELFAQRTGIRIVQIVYKGGGPAMNDFLAGHTQFYMFNMVTALQHVRSGRIRALAISTKHRSPAAPEIPTIQESGVPGFEEAGQQGMVVPIGVPKNIIAKLHSALVTAVRSAEVTRRLSDDGLLAEASTPDEYGALIRRETAKWTNMAQSLNLKSD